VASTEIRPQPDEPSLDALDIMMDVPEVLRAKWRRRQYRDGELVVASGAPADRLMILVRGHLAIVEAETRIATRSAVRLIGELAFIDDKPRSASVFAEGAVVSYELPGRDVPELMAYPAFCRNLNRELSWKLREATSERAWRFRQHEILFGAVGAFVSREVLQDLLAKGDTGEPRQAEAVTLFADIENFTGKALTMTPDELNRDLSAFLDLAVEIVLAHGGLVDKFIGDEVMALWGYAPRSNDPERALAAAVALVDGARDLRLNGEPLRIGIGLELGTVTLGVVGGEGKSSFTAVGHAVNLAARLQGLTKDLKHQICVGPALAERLPEEIKAELNGPVSTSIKGLDDQVQVWTRNPME